MVVAAPLYKQLLMLRPIYDQGFIADDGLIVLDRWCILWHFRNGLRMMEVQVQKQRILIIEDERSVAQALWRALNTPQGGGYIVEFCDSAEVALERLGNRQFDLLISDLRLPGIDGLELIEQAHQRSPGMHSILITAFGSPNVEEQACRLADAYVPKPFCLRDMIQLVRQILNEDHQGTRLTQTEWE
jgi:DNA-binding NtrC family response regulator